MMRISSTFSVSLTRPRAVAATTLVLLLAAACSDGGLTAPKPEAKTPTLSAAVVRDTMQAGSAAESRIMVGPLTNGANATGNISAPQQIDTWTFNATQGQYLVVSIGEVTGS